MSAREPEDRLDCEVLGYRQWKVNADMRLASAVAPTAWEPGVNEARCEDINTVRLLRAMGHHDVARPEPRHDAPHHECHCGFYALHEPTFWYDDDDSKYGQLSSGGDQAVAGLVAGWGRVEVHHEGFRSQFARVVAIAAPKDKRGATLARAVAEEYGVPCVPRDELERVAGEFGSPVPLGVRPDLPKREVADVTWPAYGSGNFYSPVATSSYTRGGGYLGATGVYFPASSGNHLHLSTHLTYSSPKAHFGTALNSAPAGSVLAPPDEPTRGKRRGALMALGLTVWGSQFAIDAGSWELAISCVGGAVFGWNVRLAPVFRLVRRLRARRHAPGLHS